MNPHNKALKYLERALEIMQRATANPKTYTSLTLSAFYIGCCYLMFDCLESAVYFFNKWCVILQRESINAATVEILSIAAQQIAKCVLKQAQKHNKSIGNCCFIRIVALFFFV